MVTKVTCLGKIQRFPGHRTVDFEAYMKENNVMPLKDYEGYNSHITYACKRCSKPTITKFSSLRMSKNKLFLCEECRKIWLWELTIKKGQALTQDKMDKYFKKYNCKLVDQYVNNGSKMRFICSCGEEGITSWVCLRYGRSVPRCKICRSKNAHFRPGKDHPNYNHELTDADRKCGRRKEGDVAWKRKILSRGKCCITGDTKGPFSAHHLLSYRRFPDKRTDLNNGVCILRRLHIKFHTIYGYTKFTPQDFHVFATQEHGNLTLYCNEEKEVSLLKGSGI